MNGRLLSVLALLFLVLVSTVPAHDEVTPEPPSDWQDVDKYAARLEAATAYHRQTKKAFAARLGAAVREPSTKKCNECYDITQILIDVAMNNATSTWAMKEGIALCHALFKNDTILKDLCDAIPKAIMDIVHYGTDSGANVQNIVCADFLRLCSQPCCKQPRAPEQLHLSFAANATLLPKGDAGPIRVGWVTLDLVADAQVEWRVAGSSDSEWPSRALPELRNYDVGDWIGNLYFAVMSPLTPDVTYQYRVGSPTTQWSTVYNFTTLPANAGSPARPLRVIGIADMGFGPNGQPTINAIKNLVLNGKVDFIVHPGDVGYADADQSWWDDFFREMEPIMARVPYMTGPGNHECIWYNCTAYKMRFYTPPAGLGAPSDAMFYSIHIPAAGTTFVMLDSETWYNTPNVGPVQRAWLTKTLDVRVPEGPLIFAMHHRPMYCSSYSIVDCTTFSYSLRDQVEPLYKQYNVSAVMVGHVHNYERSWPVYNGTKVSSSYTNAPAPVYFVNGGAGNREGQAKFYTDDNVWSAVRTMERTYMTYSIVGIPHRNITMQARAVRSTSGDVLDSVDVVRSWP